MEIKMIGYKQGHKIITIDLPITNTHSHIHTQTHLNSIEVLNTDKFYHTNMYRASQGFTSGCASSMIKVNYSYC